MSNSRATVGEDHFYSRTPRFCSLLKGLTENSTIMTMKHQYVATRHQDIIRPRVFEQEISSIFRDGKLPISTRGCRIAISRTLYWQRAIHEFRLQIPRSISRCWSCERHSQKTSSRSAASVAATSADGDTVTISGRPRRRGATTTQQKQLEVRLRKKTCENTESTQ